MVPDSVLLESVRLSAALESPLLELLPLGFNDLMHGYFRTLCVGYGLYAVGNTILIVLVLYECWTGLELYDAFMA